MTSASAVCIVSLAGLVLLVACGNDFNGPSLITVTAVTPATGALAGGTSVTITGTTSWR